MIFIADNALLVEVAPDGGVTISINKIPVEVATIYFNDAISFVPCFKYARVHGCRPNIAGGSC